MRNTNTIMGVLTALAFLSVGIAALFWPEKIQEFSLKYYTNHPFLAKLNPFLGGMRTQSYLVSLRIIGVFALAGSLLVFYALIWGVER